jgi:hypothetical protein
MEAFVIAPYRITTPAKGRRGGATDDFDSYLDRLVKMIPAEVVSLYLVGVGFVPKTDAAVLTIWAALCLVGLLALRTYGTAPPSSGKSPQPGAIAISAIAFTVWVYTLGGPFEAFGLHVPYIGSLLVLAMTFFAPIFYKGERI